MPGKWEGEISEADDQERGEREAHARCPEGYEGEYGGRWQQGDNGDIRCWYDSMGAPWTADGRRLLRGAVDRNMTGIPAPTHELRPRPSHWPPAHVCGPRAQLDAYLSR